MELEAFFRLLLAVILGGVIGWEREKNIRPAGFRTHILVSVASALLMMVSNQMMHNALAGFNADPGRIAAQVVSGMGFLGAGTIIREGFSVKGLTTAASLWTIAAIGLAIGAGLYFISIVTTLMVFITLNFLTRIERNMVVSGYKKLSCKVLDKPNILGEIGHVLGAEGLNIDNLNINRDISQQDLVLELFLHLKSREDINKINQKLLSVEGLKEVRWNDV